MSTPAIGPTLVSTIVSKNPRASVEAWCEYLHQHVHSEVAITENTATSWGYPGLAGHKLIWLANELNEPWLRILESPYSEQRAPFKTYGWLSLEIGVEDVDQLQDSPFEIIGKPANLDVSDNIRAMQVVGLDGEVLYLTQVNAPVPPFELPLARCPVDKLFIPVAMVPDRANALEFYERFEHTKGLQFDTKISVINNALGFEHEHRHPVATVQLAGENLVELDQVDGLEHEPTVGTFPLTGIASISFEVDALPDDCISYKNIYGPEQGRLCCMTTGTAGESIELVERAH